MGVIIDVICKVVVVLGIVVLVVVLIPGVLIFCFWWCRWGWLTDHLTSLVDTDPNVLVSLVFIASSAACFFVWPSFEFSPTLLNISVW